MSCGYEDDEEVMIVWGNSKREPAKVLKHMQFGIVMVWVHKGQYVAKAMPEWLERKRVR